MAAKHDRSKVWYISGISEEELQEFSKILNKKANSLDKADKLDERSYLITLFNSESYTTLKILLPRNVAESVTILPGSSKPFKVRIMWASLALPYLEHEALLEENYSTPDSDLEITQSASPRLKPVDKVEITLNPLWVDQIEREDGSVQKIILKNNLEHLELKRDPAVFVCDSLSSADRIVGKIEEYTKEKLALKHKLNPANVQNGKTSHASTLQDDDHRNGIKNISIGSVENDEDVNISQSSNESRKTKQNLSNTSDQSKRNRVLLTQDTTSTRTQSFVQNKRKPDVDDNVSVRSFRSSSPDDSAGQSKAPSKARVRRSNSMDTIQRALLTGGKREFTTPLTKIKVEVVEGNITDQIVNAIVNPANENLVHLAGAAKAIAQAAGKQLEKESKEYILKYKRLEVAKPMHTTAGKLQPAVHYVIHIVGPRLTSSTNIDTCRKVLIEAFVRCLIYANKELRVTSIAIPAVSSGAFGVPKDVVASASFEAVKRYDKFMESNHRRYLKIVKFVNIDKESTQALEAECLKLNSSGPSTRVSPGNSANGFSKSSAITDKNSKDLINSGAKPQIRGAPSKPVGPVNKMLGVLTKKSDINIKCPNCGERSVVEPRIKCPHKCCINCKKKDCSLCRTQGSLDEDETKTRQIPNVDNKVSSSRGVTKDKPGLNGDDSQSTYDKNASQGPAVRRSLSMPPRKTLSTQPNCAICMDDITDPKTLRCGHVFCSSCIDQAFTIKKKCPICGSLYEPMTGNQPDGDMIINQSYLDIPGYPGDGSIEIIYRIPSGTQTSEHPNPGMLYQGTTRKAYLPNNVEGQEICELLKKAFAAKLIFTVGKSATSGKDNCVTWNDIHHKTSYSGSYGYPDPSYLSRVKAELAAKGISNDPAPDPIARPPSPSSHETSPDDRSEPFVRHPGEQGSFRANKPQSPRGGRESPSNVASTRDPAEPNSKRNRKGSSSTTQWYDETSQSSATATAATDERSRKGSTQWYADSHLPSSTTAAAAAAAAGGSSSTRYDKTLYNDTLRYKVDPTDSSRYDYSSRHHTLNSHGSLNQYHSLDPYITTSNYRDRDYASSNSHSNPVSTHSRDIAVSNGDKLFTGGRSNSFYGTTSKTSSSNSAPNRTRPSSVRGSSYKDEEYRLHSGSRYNTKF